MTSLVHWTSDIVVTCWRTLCCTGRVTQAAPTPPAPLLPLTLWLAGYNLGQRLRFLPSLATGALFAMLGSAAHGGLLSQPFLVSQTSYLAAVGDGLSTPRHWAECRPGRPLRAPGAG